MRIGTLVVGWAIVVIALTATGISVLFTYRFGWSLGHTNLMRHAYALAAGGFDVFKSILPVIALGALGTLKPAERWMSWTAFAVFTAMSMMATVGNLAIQTKGRDGDKLTETRKQDLARSTLDRLLAERKTLPAFTFTSGEAVEAARVAAGAADRAAEAECQNGRGSRCRAREEDAKAARDRHAQAVANLALSEKAGKLDAQISAVESALSQVDVRTITAETDPFAAAFAAAFPGLTAAQIGFLGHLLIGIAIEVASGFGLAIAFRNLHNGSAAVPGHYEEVEAEDPVMAAQEASEIDPGFGSVAHFFRDCTRRVTGKRAQKGIAFDLYTRWCEKQGVQPLTKAKFMRATSDRDADKVGGEVYFLNCDLIHDFKPSVIPLRRAA